MNSKEVIELIENSFSSFGETPYGTKLYVINEFDLEELKKKLTLTDVVKSLIGKETITYEDYLDKFYIEKGMTYQSKRTGKIVGIDEPKKRYDWYCKYN